ncbi:MAG: hypothetical protein K8R77_03760 [Anaerolineaceae bacterium]|nr:hypothetical protein [Anaerolineaceae bacterium]
MSRCQNLILTFSMLCMVLLLSACGGTAPASTEMGDVPAGPPTATLEPTATEVPTAIPTETPVPSATPTITPTPTATFQADFTTAGFYTAGPLTGFRFLIAVELKEPVKGEYYALVKKNKEYTCEVLAAYPNRLYCTGRQAAAQDYVTYQIFETATDRPVFAGEVWCDLPLR